MDIMSLFRRNKPPQKLSISKIQIKDIAEARELKKSMLKEVLNDANYYINSSGQLDMRKSGEIEPFAHLMDLRSQKEEDVIGKMMRPLTGTPKNKLYLEAKLRAIQFIKDNLVEDATITDGYVNELQALLVDQFNRGFRSKPKSKSRLLRKRRKR